MFDRPNVPSASDAGSPDSWDVYRNLLALKRLGFSLDEMATLDMSDFIALTDLAFTGKENDEKEDAPHEATQADIDRLLG